MPTHIERRHEVLRDLGRPTAALDAGATRDEIAAALEVAVLMGGGPATVYAGEAMAALDEPLPESSAA